MKDISNFGSYKTKCMKYFHFWEKKNEYLLKDLKEINTSKVVIFSCNE